MTDYSIDIIKDTSYTIELNEQGPQGIQGERGIQGPVGPVGPKGDIGPANTLTVGSVTKGEEAEVTIEGKSPNQTINFVLPKGDKGDAATITIGEVKTGEPNTQASVTNVGTSTDSILNFSIPRGYKGEAATIVVGSTTTSEPGTEANVVNSGDENMAILEFTIPKGDKGDIGEQGPQGEQGVEGPQGPQGLSGISVTGVEQISKVGLVATYRMLFSDGTHFDYEVTDGSVDGVTREQVISLIGYEPASYTSVEGLTTRVSTLEDRVEDLTTALDSKQDKGNYALKSEIPTNNNQLANGAGYITSSYHDSTKQDVISDLENIRAGAAKGATAIQNTNDCVHKTGNETIAGVKTFTGNPVFSNDAFGGQLSVNRTNNSGGYSTVKFLNGGTVKGYLGIDSKGNPIYCNSSNTGYNIVRNSTIDKAVGSATKPVYINSSGVATAITSYEGNSATATKATKDGNGNNIVNTYATKTSLNAKADTSLSNITDAGKKVIKDNSGGWNPPLLSTMWSDHLLNDMSWLRADTFSWQDGTTYSSVYNELLSEYNNSASTTKTDGNITYKLTPKGYKIALANQETAILNKYNSDGIAWYYILDNGDNADAEGGKPRIGDTSGTNKRFKLPRAKHPSLVNTTNHAPVVGNGMALGLTTGSTNYGLIGRDINGGNTLNASPNAYGVNVGTNISYYNDSFRGAYGVTTNPTKSGIVADLSSNVKDYNMYLYFYVGNFTESAEAQTAGLNSELLNGKADVDTPSIQAPYLKNTYVNGRSGYRIWSDGYCEQWGRVSATSQTVKFLKPFANTNYCITGGLIPGNTAATYEHLNIGSLTTTSFYYSCYDRYQLMWKAVGYIA